MGRGRPRNHAPEGYYTVTEAAELLGITPAAIRLRIKKGTLPTAGDDVTGALEPRHYIPKGIVESEAEEKTLPASRSQVDINTGLLMERFERFEEMARKASTERLDIERAVKGQDEHISGRLDRLQENQEAMRDGLEEAIKVMREAAAREKAYQDRMLEMLDREAERQEQGRIERRSWVRRFFFGG